MANTAGSYICVLATIAAAAMYSAAIAAAAKVDMGFLLAAKWSTEPIRIAVQEPTKAAPALR